MNTSIALGSVVFSCGALLLVIYRLLRAGEASKKISPVQVSFYKKNTILSSFLSLGALIAVLWAITA
jgi:hypothetical protein